MKAAMAEKAKLKFYTDKPCRFIYRTTGPVLVGKTLEARGDQPHTTVFSMCRPVQDLETLISLDGTGRVICHRSGMKSYDVLSAFLMSYSTSNQQGLPPLAAPVPQTPLAAQGSSQPAGQRRKWLRYSFKQPQRPETEAEDLPITAPVAQLPTQPDRDTGGVMVPANLLRVRNQQRLLLTEKNGGFLMT